jgi:serine/threonine protein phosphatase PrpC
MLRKSNFSKKINFFIHFWYIKNYNLILFRYKNLALNGVENCSLFAVYDGHGGTQNCNFLKEELHRYMLKDMDLNSPELHISKALNSLDQDFIHRTRE